ncbi:hypothetical protein NDU88_001037, partial [Pleurodeles waltl]
RLISLCKEKSKNISPETSSTGGLYAGVSTQYLQSCHMEEQTPVFAKHSCLCGDAAADSSLEQAVFATSLDK